MTFMKKIHNFNETYFCSLNMFFSKRNISKIINGYLNHLKFRNNRVFMEITCTKYLFFLDISLF